MTRGIIEEVSDAELLHAGARGDGGAFGELYERHKRYLWSIALRTAQDPDDAEDALQDALVSIVRSTEKPSPRAPMRSPGSSRARPRKTSLKW